MNSRKLANKESERNFEMNQEDQRIFERREEINVGIESERKAPRKESNEG